MTKKIDEGYIKFNCDWTFKPLQINIPDDLLVYRDKLHEHKLIGHVEDLNIGYGNISIKTADGIIVSGTQTGHIFPITKESFTLVTHYEISNNNVVCEGPVKASSETMTHAALYEVDENIKAIIHVHHAKMWKKLLYQLPTTNSKTAYGTPEMALEIKRLFNDNDFNKTGNIIIMAGHEDGIISFGKDLKEAYNILLKHF